PHAAPLLVRLEAAAARLRLPVMTEPVFGAFAALEVAPDAGDLLARLAALPRAEAEATVLRLVQEEIGRILRLPAEAVKIESPVAGLGLDSLGALELRSSLEGRLGRQVPIAALSEELTVAALARQIASAALEPATEEATLAALAESFEPTTGAARAAG
uniref:acyl carrier protein n=1 Tax=Falsiroseomonas oryzae TaxID=2766473 RepID=UPI0022EA4E9B